MNGEVMNGKETPLWRRQLIATVKKNLALRTKGGDRFFVSYNLLILSIFLSSFFLITPFQWYQSSSKGMSLRILFYYIMSSPSFVWMVKEKHSGIRNLMLQVSGSSGNNMYYSILFLFASSVGSILYP